MVKNNWIKILLLAHAKTVHALNFIVNVFLMGLIVKIVHASIVKILMNSNL